MSLLIRGGTVVNADHSQRADVYCEGLDAVAMPQAIAQALSLFVAEHHVERVFVRGDEMSLTAEAGKPAAILDGKRLRRVS